MDRKAWRAAVHRVTKSGIQLSNRTTMILHKVRETIVWMQYSGSESDNSTPAFKYSVEHWLNVFEREIFFILLYAAGPVRIKVNRFVVNELMSLNSNSFQLTSIICRFFFF